METNFIRLRLRSNLLLFIMLLFSWNTFAQGDTQIPDKYSDLYRKLEFTLDEQLKTENVKFAVNQTHKPLFMCTDLLVANSNRGEILLKPETLAGVKFSLNSFSKLGIGCVKFAVQYPLLTEDFPRNKEYLEFYKQVISEAHKLGIKVMPHVSVIFANTPFSPLKGIYKGLTLEKFKTDYRKMVMLIAQELKI